MGLHQTKKLLHSKRKKSTKEKSDSQDGRRSLHTTQVIGGLTPEYTKISREIKTPKQKTQKMGTGIGPTFHKGTNANGKQTYEKMLKLPGNKGKSKLRQQWGSQKDSKDGTHTKNHQQHLLAGLWGKGKTSPSPVRMKVGAASVAISVENTQTNENLHSI